MGSNPRLGDPPTSAKNLHYVIVEFVTILTISEKICNSITSVYFLPRLND